MGKGWDRFKTILLNIFTEEVEVEVKEPKKQPAQEQQPIRKEVKETVRVRKSNVQQTASMNETQRRLNRDKNSFRFPVIPDSPKERQMKQEQGAEEAYIEKIAKEKQFIYEKQLQRKQQKKQPVATMEKQPSNKQQRPVKTEAELALERRLAEQEQRRLQRRKVRKYSEQHVGSYERQYAAYEKEKSLKQMDKIPAFVRRANSDEEEQVKRREQSEEPSVQEMPEHHVEEQANTHSKKEVPVISPYSTPDELDTIFRKIDAVLTEDEHDTDKAFEQPETELVYTKRDDLVDQTTDGQIQDSPIVEQLLNKQAEITTKRIDAKEQEVDGLKQDSDDIAKRIEQVRTTEPKVTTDAPIVHDIPHYLLDDPQDNDVDDQAWLEEQQFLLERTLTHFKIRAKVVHVTQGPTVTRFEIQPELGVKVSTIRNLADDLKLNLAAKEIRIEAPIPGKNTVGIEIPNAFPQMVTLQQIIESDAFEVASSPLSIALGVTIEGDPLITDIGKMPHGLIAGATGSGKSVCINTILLSLLYKANHDDVKFLLIDPKMVELAPYNGIPHLVSPVITDVKAATAALKWAVQEMEDRYEQFVHAEVRNITKYNEKVTAGHIQGNKMPYIVIVIDELADLMMVSPQDVEDAICRIAQKARACGMHLLLATQRPSVDVITGLIKANIPTRIAFTVSSQVDSRTIIDTNGAEKLLGRGDMLFMENGSGRSLRLQGPFVTDEEIERVTAYMRQIAEPNYLFEQEQLLVRMEEEEQDELFEEVLLFVLEQNQASTSLLQRQFRIGYNRAARLIDTLHAHGVISAQNGAKPREVLITYEQADELFFTK